MTRTLFIGDGAMPLSLVPGCFGRRKQHGRDLGARLGNAFDFLLRRHSRALVIGTDSPAITPSTLRLALDELRSVGVALALYPLSAFRAMNKAALNVYQTLRREGTQKNVVATMQTRDELYEYLDYHAYEEKLDELFSARSNA